jgi:hypothetical protein
MLKNLRKYNVLIDVGPFGYYIIWIVQEMIFGGCSYEAWPSLREIVAGGQTNGIWVICSRLVIAFNNIANKNASVVGFSSLFALFSLGGEGWP